MFCRQVECCDFIVGKNRRERNGFRCGRQINLAKKKGKKEQVMRGSFDVGLRAVGSRDRRSDQPEGRLFASLPVCHWELEEQKLPKKGELFSLKQKLNKEMFSFWGENNWILRSLCCLIWRKTFYQIGELM